MSTAGKNEANPMSLFYTGGTELCFPTHHCHQELDLGGLPKVLPQASVFLPLTLGRNSSRGPVGHIWVGVAW